VALEIADYGVVLGNEKTVDSYRYAGKPLFALSAPTVTDMSWNDEKDFDACRNRFVWFGSGGLVHKGLDLVLEAFAEMPEAHLTVCGPIESESMFRNEYRKELYETQNIRLAGWVDVNGDVFRETVRQSVGIVYPSCAEGQATSVLNCMRAGLIPILTPEAGIPIGDFGFSLEHTSIASIKDAVRHLASLPRDNLASRARRTWEHAITFHSHEAYKSQYREIITSIATRCGK
jgi:glycosyltransferase involved in cell wall biosynthesis